MREESQMSEQPTQWDYSPIVPGKVNSFLLLVWHGYQKIRDNSQTANTAHAISMDRAMVRSLSSLS